MTDRTFRLVGASGGVGGKTLHDGTLGAEFESAVFVVAVKHASPPSTGTGTIISPPFAVPGIESGGASHAPAAPPVGVNPVHRRS